MELRRGIAQGKGSVGKGTKEIFQDDGENFFCSELQIYNLGEIAEIFFCSVNSKQGLAKWLHAFINLLDNVKLFFRKLHHTMLSEHFHYAFQILILNLEEKFGIFQLSHRALPICMMRNHIPLLFWFAFLLLPIRFHISS